MDNFPTPPNLDLTLNSYQKPITVISSEEKNNLYYGRYKKLLREEGRGYADWGSEKELMDYMLKEVSFHGRRRL